MFDIDAWHDKQIKKLDKKYYNKGMPIYVIHMRVLSTACKVVEQVFKIDVKDLSLSLYMLIKDKGFSEFVHKYEYVVEMAREKPDVFAEQLYQFYSKMAKEIKENNYYGRFFEFESYFRSIQDEIVDEKERIVYDAYIALLFQQIEFLRSGRFDLNSIVAGITTDGKLIEVSDLYPNLDFPAIELQHRRVNNKGFDFSTCAQLYKKYGYDINCIDDIGIITGSLGVAIDTIICLTPYINQFTVDILPKERFNICLSDYMHLILFYQ